jgi:hypothetical protein
VFIFSFFPLDFVYSFPLDFVISSSSVKNPVKSPENVEEVRKVRKKLEKC